MNLALTCIACSVLALSACNTYTSDDYLLMKEKCKALDGTPTRFINSSHPFAENGLICSVDGIPFKIKK